MTGLRVCAVVGLLAVSFCSKGQALDNTSWKAFYTSLRDTVKLHFAGDSSSVSSSTGAVFLLSTFKLSKDIITFHDIGGLSKCANVPGSYHVKLDADTLVFVMDEEPCDARGGILIAKKWIRVGNVGGAGGDRR